MWRTLVIIWGIACLCPSVLSAQWEPDFRLTYDDSISYLCYNNAWCVAAEGETTHVVWHDSRFVIPEVYYKRSLDNGTTWETDVRLTNWFGHSGCAAVAVSGTNVHVAWCDERDGHFEIYYKRSIDGGVCWESDTRLTYADDCALYPCIAVSGDYVHVVWMDTRDGVQVCEVYYKRSTDGGTTWGPDTRLTYTNCSAGMPSIAVLGANIHVGYSDHYDGNNEIYYMRSTDAGASWQQYVRLTNDNASSLNPSIAVAGSGVHVVWIDERDGNKEIYYKRAKDGGAVWSGDIRLTNAPAESRHPSICADGNNVHVVWCDKRTGENDVYYKLSTDYGVSWEPDTLLTNGSEEHSWYPSVTVSGTAVHVVWTDWRDGNFEIYYKRNLTGNTGVYESTTQHRDVLWQDCRVAPNPFSSYAIVQGREEERFVLYDSAGRLVGKYGGDRIGEGLPVGVYLLIPEMVHAKPTLIVKVGH